MQRGGSQYEYLLFGSVSEANLDALLHRLRGLCDYAVTGGIPFKERELTYKIGGRGLLPTVNNTCVCNMLHCWLAHVHSHRSRKCSHKGQSSAVTGRPHCTMVTTFCVPHYTVYRGKIWHVCLEPPVENSPISGIQRVRDSIFTNLPFHQF